MALTLNCIGLLLDKGLVLLTYNFTDKFAASRQKFYDIPYDLLEAQPPSNQMPY